MVITAGKEALVPVHATVTPLYGWLDLGLAQANIRELVSRPVAGGPENIAEKHRFKKQLGPGGPLVDLDTRSSKIEVN